MVSFRPGGAADASLQQRPEQPPRADARYERLTTINRYYGHRQYVPRQQRRVRRDVHFSKPKTDAPLHALDLRPRLLAKMAVFLAVEHHVAPLRQFHIGHLTPRGGRADRIRRQRRGLSRDQLLLDELEVFALDGQLNRVAGHEVTVEHRLSQRIFDVFLQQAA